MVYNKLVKSDTRSLNSEMLQVIVITGFWS
jgi:hypothetical protein